MSKYTITRACGHTETIQIYGPTKDREWKAECESQKVCAVCYAAEQAHKREAENKVAAAFSVEQCLPALEGTPKQIAWAEKIRAEVAKSLFAMREKLQNQQLSPEKKDARAIGVVEINKVLARTSAKDWIETREKTYGQSWLIHRVEEAIKNAAA